MAEIDLDGQPVCCQRLYFPETSFVYTLSPREAQQRWGKPSGGMEHLRAGRDN